MRKILLCALIVLFGGVTGASAADLKTDEQKTLYALGLALGQNLAIFNLSDSELESVQAGIADAARDKPKQVDLSAYGPKVQQLYNSRLAAISDTQKKAGQAFVAKAAAEPGATKTASGIVITAIKPGNGASPKPTDSVKVHYHGTLIDGSVFDSSIQRGEPVTFALNGVIPCWTEGLQQMKVGGKSRLVCPSEVAYGERGVPPNIKPGATLVFEVELLEIVKKP